jgi:hypothetical protein
MSLASTEYVYADSGEIPVEINTFKYEIADVFHENTKSQVKTAQADDSSPAVISSHQVELESVHREIEANIVYGGGRASEGGNTGWRDYQVSFGEALNDYTFVSFAYYNEGHSDNNHRDGFAVLGAARLPLWDRFKVAPDLPAPAAHPGSRLSV